VDPDNQASSAPALTHRLAHARRGTLVQQVRSVIQTRIVAGAYSDTGRLPSTRQLAQELGTSRSTVVAAYDQLVGEGYVEARERSGLFVNRELLATDRESSAHLEANWSGRLVRRFTRPTGPPADWQRYPYPFVTGQMDRALFPARAWLTQLRRALDGPHASASLDDRGGDDPQLLEALCRVVLPSRGFTVRPDEVVVTMGSQHGLSMLCSLLLRPEDLVAMEDPGYPEARHLFRSFGARVRALPVDDRGLQVARDDLAGVRLLHVTPSHHHPTNVTTTAARRRRLLAAAEAHDTVVVEDDYDSELQYRGRPIPALTSTSIGDRCVYLGSFSKLLAPGLRLGFMVASPDLIAAVRDMQRMTTRQVPGQLQRALAGFLMSEDYYRTLRRVRRKLKRRWEVLTEAAATHLSLADDAFPPGGTSLWLRSAGADWTNLPAAAAEHGVALTPQTEFYAHQRGPVRHLRLGFTAIPTERIEPGVRALAAAAADL
jgi:GntR family transcriptional regulator/MocR family aminotransferase